MISMIWLNDPQWIYIQRLILAAFLGLLVGAEREARDKAAGIRTQALVCSGAAAFAIVSAHGFPGSHPDTILDPSRVAAQVATGIGFLGAGAIVIQKERVLGLTTAATIWLMAAVGLLAGAGMTLSAVGATGISLFVLEVVDHTVVKRFFHREGRTLKITIERSPDVLGRLEEAVVKAGGDIPEFKSIKGDNGKDTVIFRVEGDMPLSSIADHLRVLPEVHDVEVSFHSEL